MGTTYAELPAFLTPKQLAELTCSHEGSVRRGIREGRVPAEKVNGRWLIPKELAFPQTRKGVEHEQAMA